MKGKFVSLLSLIGISLTIVELTLKAFHSTLCSTQGCMLITKSVRFSDNIIVISGLLVFILIFIFSLSKNKHLHTLINHILIVALSAEGVFVGYQLFRMKHICLFCISVFSIFILISVMKLLNKEFEILSGFISFFSILFLFYILKPIYITTIPVNKPLVLIYKHSCSHCEKVIKEAKKSKINIYLIKVNNCLGLLKSLNIKEVPLLIVNNKGEKKMIIGEHNILQYLLKKKNIPNNNLYNSFFKNEKGFCTIGEKCK